ncbi:MarR family winged helix-turn-helix transcriptional regulator [Microbacterium sp. AK031]|uniref:MarR family winged helix-turn-helix transcriptional regulator n=1 Tax=Microbacterium sp. AK031 TaxID=2723076 RepID=UPI002168E072|nr:MarR family transcriptional regulator [Microbacterium sp. AK031]MCS3842481.1 DNA-binding MarR family transcriptional regulator [Microbacterium sp. AK031]
MSLLHDLPTWLLAQASLRAHDILLARLSEVGARGYDYRILEVLSAATPLSQVAIGSLARMDRRDVSVILAALAEDGLIERRPDPDDARRNVVEITDSGRARHQDLLAVMTAIQEEVLAPLDEQSRTAFIDALRLLQPSR